MTHGERERERERVTAQSRLPFFLLLSSSLRDEEEEEEEEKKAAKREKGKEVVCRGVCLSLLRCCCLPAVPSVRLLIVVQGRYSSLQFGERTPVRSEEESLTCKVIGSVSSFSLGDDLLRGS